MADDEDVVVVAETFATRSKRPRLEPGAPPPGLTATGDFSLDCLQCPICLDLLYDPCVVTCGHQYCQLCIKQVCASTYDSGCPICRATLPTSTLGVNRTLKVLIERLHPEDSARRAREAAQDKAAADRALAADTERRARAAAQALSGAGGSGPGAAAPAPPAPALPPAPAPAPAGPWNAAAAAGLLEYGGAPLVPPSVFGYGVRSSAGSYGYGGAPGTSAEYVLPAGYAAAGGHAPLAGTGGYDGAAARSFGYHGDAAAGSYTYASSLLQYAYVPPAAWVPPCPYARYGPGYRGGGPSGGYLAPSANVAGAPYSLPPAPVGPAGPGYTAPPAAQMHGAGHVPTATMPYGGGYAPAAAGPGYAGAGGGPPMPAPFYNPGPPAGWQRPWQPAADDNYN